VSQVGASIRAEIEQAILSGTWPVGARIPTEHALMQTHGCARMTVHRVLSGLAERGLIVRRRRAGSFVAAPAAEQTVLTIADFAAEAARTGRTYCHRIADLGRRTGAPGFDPADRLVAVRCTHLFDAVPVAWEDRLIRLASVPAAARARFRAEPPGTWLLRHVPWSEAEHEITAVLADAAMARRLGIKDGDPLLCLHRRTWHQGAIVTDVRFAFPGAAYRFTGRFSPADGRQ
jgi:GntR family histidine utilization transcriptional repressor